MMSKKVLIISSSPRKGGNSETLAAAFAKGAQEAGHQVETVFAGGVNEVGDIIGHPALERAYQVGKEI